MKTLHISFIALFPFFILHAIGSAAILSSESDPTQHYDGFIYEVVLPENYDPEQAYPLLYVCHGGHGNIERAKIRWQCDYLFKHYITVYLQSCFVPEKPARENAHFWIANTRTREGLREINLRVHEDYKIVKDRVYVGGMSNGGMMALDVAFEGYFKVNGFVVNCPLVSDKLTLKKVKRATKMNKRGVIITGSKDWGLEKQEILRGYMEEIDFPFEMTIIEGMEHEIPKDFASHIEKGLKFVEQRP